MRVAEISKVVGKPPKEIKLVDVAHHRIWSLYVDQQSVDEIRSADRHLPLVDCSALTPFARRRSDIFAIHDVEPVVEPVVVPEGDAWKKVKPGDIIDANDTDRRWYESTVMEVKEGTSVSAFMGGAARRGG